MLLELDGLTRRFGGLVAVDRVTMKVTEGEVRAVIGPNGAGKSTLFNLITGVIKPSDGTVRFAGEGLTGLSVPRICRRGIARTFQLTALFPEMSARENVRLAAQAREPRHWRFLGSGAIFAEAGKHADTALELLGLTGLADRLAGLLSHGDQRLLEIAMALAQRPRLLLLDEPTQGLSVEETAQAVENLAALLRHGNLTVLLVEHDMEVIFRLADKITVLHRGAVIADGPPQTIRDDSEVQRAYLGGLLLMLTIEALSAHYGASHVLQGVDLALGKGRIAAVLGRNGVGKTTTVRAVMGLVPPTGGHVLLEGVEIAGWAAHRIARAGVAYVPEGRQIFPDLNVVENIRVAERRKARIWPLDRLFELFPALRERAGNKGGQLSGGEQQMLAIARALASDPKVLLLDEPSQGLAPLVVRELAQVIRLLRSDGVAILLIEQNVKLAEEVADEINVMVKGRIGLRRYPHAIPL